MLRNFIMLLTAVLVFSSCTTIKFETPQPKDVEALIEFPADVTGTYMDADNVALSVTKTSFKYGNKKSPVYLSKTLSPGQTVLKKYNDDYVVSIKDKSAWEVFTFTYNDKGLKAYYMDVEDSTINETVAKVKAVVPLKEVKDTEGKLDYYTANPSKAEFDKLLKGKVFSKVIVFRKVK